MSNKVARADVVKLLGVTVVAIVHLRQETIAIGVDDEVISTRKQGIPGAFWKRPRDRIIDIEICLLYTSDAADES